MVWRNYVLNNECSFVSPNVRFKTLCLLIRNCRVHCILYYIRSILYYIILYYIILYYIILYYIILYYIILIKQIKTRDPYFHKTILDLFIIISPIFMKHTPSVHNELSLHNRIVETLSFGPLLFCPFFEIPGTVW